MHYPQCNGTGDWSLVLTSRDVTGAVDLYGAPGSGGEPEPEPPADGKAVTVTVSGSLAASEANYHGPYHVVAGTAFKAAMGGTGDPDLYVRFGATPTTSAYHCRPYLSGANETCELTVPTGETEAYIMVRGYSAATYEVTIDYVTDSASSDPEPILVNESVSGYVANSASDSYGPYQVVGGTAFTAAMSGDGDPDLYVRFGAAPTTSVYDCRPYLSGASETCELTVPTGETKAYLMIRGYAAANYAVDLTYYTNP
jgi:hypothetical protein